MSKLDELESLEKAATPGPRLTVLDEEDMFEDDKIHVTNEDRITKSMEPTARVSVGFDEPFESEQRANADLIAASRNALPALLRLARAAERFFSDEEDLGSLADARDGIHEALRDLGVEV